MYTVSDVMEVMNRLAPPALAEAWDNPGLMLGDPAREVQKIYVCLDVDGVNAEQAIRLGADLILSHHPLLFHPMKQIVEDNAAGSIVRRLITNDIAVFSAHTNLDKAEGGMNDWLAEKLGLSSVRPFREEEIAGDMGIGRIGILDPPMEMEDFVSFVKGTLNCPTLRYAGDPNDVLSTVALCSGGGGDGIKTAYRAGADVYITADVRHHEAQLAAELGLNLIDAGHFETENIICEFLPPYLEENLPGLTILVSDVQGYLK